MSRIIPRNIDTEHEMFTRADPLTMVARTFYEFMILITTEYSHADEVRMEQAAEDHITGQCNEKGETDDKRS